MVVGISISHFYLESQFANLLCCFTGIAELFPRIMIIGALGRCGKGALDMAIKVGIPV